MAGCVCYFFVTSSPLEIADSLSLASRDFDPCFVCSISSVSFGSVSENRLNGPLVNWLSNYNHKAWLLEEPRGRVLLFIIIILGLRRYFITQDRRLVLFLPPSGPWTDLLRPQAIEVKRKHNNCLIGTGIICGPWRLTGVFLGSVDLEPIPD